MDTDIKATLYHWIAIELYTLEGKTAEMVIYGIPTHVPDEFVLTSSVEGIEQESESAALVTTRNSVYRLTGPGRHYRLPLHLCRYCVKGKILPKLRDIMSDRGESPDTSRSRWRAESATRVATNKWSRHRILARTADKSVAEIFAI